MSTLFYSSTIKTSKTLQFGISKGCVKLAHFYFNCHINKRKFIKPLPTIECPDQISTLVDQSSIRKPKLKEFVMKISPFVLLVFLVSCSKKIDVVVKKADVPSVKSGVAITQQKPDSCNFGIQVFNKARRAPLAEAYSFKKKPRTIPLMPPHATILLDFGGQVVSNTVWNKNGDINATPANLTLNEIDRILQRVQEDFSPFDVLVTTDEDVYNATDPYKRMRVIITESWDWFGVVGGTSYNNSFVWGNNTPCFVFSTLLSYNEKYIAEAISHETGHTLGLLHQAVYDSSCNFISEYNMGTGDGVTGWAPIMGIGYYKNVTTWHKGPTVLGCNEIQDDVAIIASVLGMKPDENMAMTKSAQFNAPTTGVINSSNDTDYYFIDLKQPTTIIAQPDCLGRGEGANLNLKLSVYDKKGVLIKTVNDLSTLSATITLNKDKYYIGVETQASQNQTRYGMLGTYTLSMTQ